MTTFSEAHISRRIEYQLLMTLRGLRDEPCDTQVVTAKYAECTLETVVLEVSPKSKLPLSIPSYPQSYSMPF